MTSSEFETAAGMWVFLLHAAAAVIATAAFVVAVVL